VDVVVENCGKKEKREFFRSWNAAVPFADNLWKGKKTTHGRSFLLTREDRTEEQSVDRSGGKAGGKKKRLR